MKRVLSVTLIVFMILAMSVSAFAAPTVPGAVYSDQQGTGMNKPVTQIQQELQQAGIQDVKPTDWFAGSVTVLIQAGLLKPTTDGKINPEANIGNSEGVAIFAKVLGIASKNDTDDQAAQKMLDSGLLDNSTDFNKDMTRLEVARLIARALGVEPKTITSAAAYPFTDFNAEGLTNEDRGILAALYDLGIFKGYADHRFGPNDPLTRAQIALLVDRILGAH